MRGEGRGEGGAREGGGARESEGFSSATVGGVPCDERGEELKVFVSYVGGRDDALLSLRSSSKLTLASS